MLVTITNHRGSGRTALILRENHPFHGEGYIVKVKDKIIYRGNTYSQCERYCNWNKYILQNNQEEMA